SRHSNENNVGLFQTLNMLAVVVQHREIQRIDALKVYRVEHVLGAGSMYRFGPEVRLEKAQDRPQHRHTRQSEFTTFFLEKLNEVFFEQSVENQTRRLGNFRQCVVELLFGTDHRIEMLDG